MSDQLIPPPISFADLHSELIALRLTPQSVLGLPTLVERLRNWLKLGAAQASQLRLDPVPLLDFAELDFTQPVEPDRIEVVLKIAERLKVEELQGSLWCRYYFEPADLRPIIGHLRALVTLARAGYSPPLWGEARRINELVSGAKLRLILVGRTVTAQGSKREVARNDAFFTPDEIRLRVVLAQIENLLGRMDSGPYQSDLPQILADLVDLLESSIDRMSPKIDLIDQISECLTLIQKVRLIDRDIEEYSDCSDDEGYVEDHAKYLRWRKARDEDQRCTPRLDWLIESIEKSAKLMGPRMDVSNWSDLYDLETRLRTLSIKLVGLNYHSDRPGQQGKDGDSKDPDVVLDAEDVAILRALEEAGTTLTQYDLAEGTSRFLEGGLSRGTISDRLERLRDAGLTHRPKGDRGGEAITSEGKARLASIAKAPGAKRAKNGH